ncbi:MAG: Flp pilus assembly complex ATPase component TadA [Nitrospirae bacterium]|nr:Flp pilus assembly complex ATPase component TadA [Nitrospirota bacterium]
MVIKLGQMLINSGIITEEQLKQTLVLQKRDGGRLGTNLVKLGYVTEEKLVTFLSKQFGVPAINLSNYKIDPAVLKLETSKILQVKDYTMSAEDMVAGGTMGESDEGPTVDVDEFDQVVGSALDDIEAVLTKDEGVSSQVDAPIIKLVNGIFVNALKAGASDIHIEPYEGVLRIRYRVDGVLHTVMNLPTKIKSPLTARVKIMSRLDIAERRLPQDGRIKLKLGPKREIDFRVSVLPCLFGEKTVLRLLDKSSLQVDLTKLGFEEKALSEFLAVLSKPYGMVLVTGPTGSGKTTTLYSALSHLNNPDVNIMTAEDPIEYNFLGINQVQMKEEIGLSFASALLLNMGIEPFLVSSSVLMIIAQRLARKLCQQCKEEEKVPIPALMKIGFSEDEANVVRCFKGKGCPTCSNSGYKGRIALYEVMPIGDEIKELVLEGASAAEIKKAAIKLGMKTLRMSGLTKVKEGVTSIEEVVRVTFGD